MDSQPLLPQSRIPQMFNRPRKKLDIRFPKQVEKDNGKNAKAITLSFHPRKGLFFGSRRFWEQLFGEMQMKDGVKITVERIQFDPIHEEDKFTANLTLTKAQK